MTHQPTKHPGHGKPIKCPKCGNPLRPSTDVAARKVTEESAQSLYCGRCGHQQWAKDKEPWNFNEFVGHYNAVAREHSGWNFEPDDHDPEQLKQSYERIEDNRNLRQYARDTFTYDQQTGVEGSD